MLSLVLDAKVHDGSGEPRKWHDLWSKPALIQACMLVPSTSSAATSACILRVCLQAGMGAGMIKLSLRSLGEEDTTVVTQAFGGGGHRNASSCLVPESEFRRWGGAASQHAGAAACLHADP